MDTLSIIEKYNLLSQSSVKVDISYATNTKHLCKTNMSTHIIAKHNVFTIIHIILFC